MNLRWPRALEADWGAVDGDAWPSAQSQDMESLWAQGAETGVTLRNTEYY